MLCRKSGNNFNSAMCKAAKVAIAEVEELVEVGQMDPNDVDVPHIYVHRVVHCPAGEKRIEVRAPLLVHYFLTSGLLCTLLAYTRIIGHLLHPTRARLLLRTSIAHYVRV